MSLNGGQHVKINVFLSTVTSAGHAFKFPGCVLGCGGVGAVRLTLVN